MLSKTGIQRALSVILAVSLWQVGSMLLGQKLLLVSPIDVLQRLATIWMEEKFWNTVAFSFTRIVSGFLLALVSGTLFAFISGKLRIVEILLWPFVIVIKSVPVASFIIISLIWLSAQDLSTFISFLMVFPIVYTNVLQGFKSVDKKLLEAVKVFGVPWRRSLLYVYLPQIKPFLISACIVGLGLSWKAGVAAEVIGIPRGSMGEMLYEAKVYLNTSDLFAWTVIIVLISVLFEKLFLILLKKGFEELEKV